jgi:1-acyl-sn-glycerol-3-phosphate acyltransferase
MARDEIHNDLFLVDKRLLQRLVPAASLIQRYFRAEVNALEKIPRGGALLVGNHNSSVITPDGFIFAWSYLKYTEYSDIPIALAHDLVFKIPIIRNWAVKIGIVPASREITLEALALGKKVIIYPGGSWESARPSKQRDVIDFKNRKGFVRTALESGMPIVPIVTAGGHDGWYVFTRGEKIAQVLGLKKHFRIEVFPLAFGLPTGIVGGIFPHIPLPRKILIEVLDPIYLVGDPRNKYDLEKGYAHVTTQMQLALSRMAEKLR